MYEILKIKNVKKWKQLKKKVKKSEKETEKNWHTYANIVWKVKGIEKGNKKKVERRREKVAEKGNMKMKRK